MRSLQRKPQPLIAIDCMGIEFEFTLFMEQVVSSNVSSKVSPAIPQTFTSKSECFLRPLKHPRTGQSTHWKENKGNQMHNFTQQIKSSWGFWSFWTNLSGSCLGPVTVGCQHMMWVFSLHLNLSRQPKRSFKNGRGQGKSFECSNRLTLKFKPQWILNHLEQTITQTVLSVSVDAVVQGQLVACLTEGESLRLPN